MAVLVEQAKARRGMVEKLWSHFAYAARYGHQPISELREMTFDELIRFINELSEIVKVEKR